jgi:phosphoribosylamine---glycine ligase
MRVLVVGGGAREHALGWALHRSGAEVVVASPNVNPGLERLATATARLDITMPGPIVDLARRERVQLAVIGPEAPLGAGVTDALWKAEIPVAGPTKAAARIETSKSFCRRLLAKYRIDAQPKFDTIANVDEVESRVKAFGEPFVVKPAGLTGGKGVWVQGADFQSADEGAAYARKLLASGTEGVVLEEKLEGEEFSQMAFVTDSGVYPMPAVQDFKRALEGDLGGNTGGLGAYSQRDHLLPFLTPTLREQAVEVVRKAAQALKEEGSPFRGVLYGGFMLTAQGPKLLEFNARFGDPEALNALTLYEEGDFDELLMGLATGRVDTTLLGFRLRATVVKYVVPPGYGAAPRSGGVINLDEPSIEDAGVRVFFGAVEAAGAGQVTLSTSRGVALVGEASAIHEASHRVDEALAFVKGDYYVRRDIGTKADLSRRTEHVRRLLVPGAKPSPLPLSVAAPDAPPSSAGTAEQVLAP